MPSCLEVTLGHLSSGSGNSTALVRRCQAPRVRHGRLLWCRWECGSQAATSHDATSSSGIWCAHHRSSIIYYYIYIYLYNNIHIYIYIFDDDGDYDDGLLRRPYPHRSHDTPPIWYSWVDAQLLMALPGMNPKELDHEAVAYLKLLVSNIPLNVHSKPTFVGHNWYKPIPLIPKTPQTIWFSRELERIFGTIEWGCSILGDRINDVSKPMFFWI